MLWNWNHNTAWMGIHAPTFADLVRRKTSTKYDVRDFREFWLLIVSGPQLSQAMGMNLGSVLPEITEVERLLGASAIRKAYVLQYMIGVAYEWPGWRRIERP